MSSATELRQSFFRQLNQPLLGESLFDQVPDIVYFVKDHCGRYIAVNKTLCQRCGAANKEQMIGKKVNEIFPDPLGIGFLEQDQQVLKTAKGINGRLELHLYPDGHQGWCLTYKEPIIDSKGVIIGVSGISRDLHTFAENGADMASVSKVLTCIQENIDQPLRLPELAKKVSLSVYQLDQRIRAIYQISTGQLITRTRIDTACHLLTATGNTISNIALECGYSDQSAFSRQFKQTTGMTPKAYREH